MSKPDQETHLPNHIVVIARAPLDRLPPAMTAARLLRDLGQRVTVITSKCPATALALLASAGISVIQTGNVQARHLSAKLIDWHRFRTRTWGVLDNLDGVSALWVSGGDTALALGRRILCRPFVLQLNELYDRNAAYRILLGPLARKATVVVVPEAARSAILRHWYGLPRTPRVLPNKFYPAPETECVPNTSHAHLLEDLRETANTRRIILYQGVLSADRNLLPLARCLAPLKDTWQFVVMGPDFGLLSQLKAVCPSLHYVPYLPAPEHFCVTAHAQVGVVAYDYSSLNNVFCAPNKIWEYARFNIPMLCNDVPGLKFAVEAAGAGVCIDFSDALAIASALQELNKNYAAYSRRSSALYEQLDVKTPMEQILSLL